MQGSRLSIRKGKIGEDSKLGPSGHEGGRDEPRLWLCLVLAIGSSCSVTRELADATPTASRFNSPHGNSLLEYRTRGERTAHIDSCTIARSHIG